MNLSCAEAELFEAAAHELRWHYQSVVLDEFLPSLIGQRLTDELLRGGCRFYRSDRGAFIPLEFADAAYRYGHSQVRQSYVVNAGGAAHAIFPDLIGFRAVALEHIVDWECSAAIGRIRRDATRRNATVRRGDRSGEGRMARRNTSLVLHLARGRRDRPDRLFIGRVKCQPSREVSVSNIMSNT